MNRINNDLYPMIFKRKSFHIFKDPPTGKAYHDAYSISDDELKRIQEIWSSLVPLDPGIRTAMRIAENEETSCQRGQEKVVLFYSEEKPNALANIGYLGEQLDLYLAQMNIGTLWFGLNKNEMPDYEDLKYVIMIAIGKVPEKAFRKDMFKAKRKELGEIWEGPLLDGASEIVRFAPSACNSQPWKVIREDDRLDVCRYRNEKKIGVMPQDGLVVYNHIDIGIFLCFLELCLSHEGISFQRTLYDDIGNETMNLVARYQLQG
ncbi:MAG: nitroreductase [Erysipelotrichaceae bacterium]|nr:nitroreductase [Erysipelotrichaceae bacterium]